MAEKLFGAGSNPVGQTVRIRNIPFQVVAVAGRKGQTPTGQDSDDVVFIPRTTFQAKIQGGLGKFLQRDHLRQRHQRRAPRRGR